MLPAKIMLELGDPKKQHFPPVTWFERVVNIALKRASRQKKESLPQSGVTAPIEIGRLGLLGVAIIDGKIV